MKLKLNKQKDKILKEIKRTILEIANEMNIEVDKIILFGSRARGDYKPKSDWDILVVTKKIQDNNIKRELWLKIYEKLTELLKSEVDLLIIDNYNYSRYKEFSGYVFYWINKEGVKL